MPPKEKAQIVEPQGNPVVFEARGEHRGISFSAELIDVLVATPKQVWTVTELSDRAELAEEYVELYLRVLADAGVVRRLDAHVEQDTYRWMWIGYGPGGRG